jgi:dihydrolipoamide dehydrogenase
MPNYDVLIIGSGPGGYVAAIRAAQRGLKTALVEKAEIGGVCLNWGCIPTKAIIHSLNSGLSSKEAEGLGIAIPDSEFQLPDIIARSRKIAAQLGKGVAALFKKHNITLIEGHARLGKAKRIHIEKNDGGSTEISASHIIIATGSRPKTLRHMPIDGKHIISSRHALQLEKTPASMAIVGAGAIGVEFAWIYRKLGVEVTLIEALDSLLPNEDAEISKELLKHFKRQKIRCLLQNKVTEVKELKEGLELTVESGDKSDTIKVEKILSAIGVQPNVEDIGLEEAGVSLENGFIKVDKNQLTTAKGIYAIGDVAGNPCLAHKASREGLIAVDHISGKPINALDTKLIPGCTYCEPQVASVGLRESDAEEAGLSYGVSKVPYRSIGKAIAIDHFDGFLKCIFDTNSGKLLGAHCIGAEATELIAELGLALTKGLSMKDLAETIHAHPTLSELIMETAENALGEGIHV